MSYEAALLAEIIAAPADDAPRLVWADQAGGPRGELVIVQCELARGIRTAAESGAFRRRQRELLAADGAAWSGLDGLAKRCRFRRGFVELATFDARIFHDHLDEVLAVAPLLGTVELEEIGEATLQRVLAHPSFRRVRGFWPERRSVINHDAIYAAGAADGAFANLVALGMPDLGRLIHRELVRSRQLRNIERLAISGSADAVIELFATMPNLRALDLTFQGNLEVIVAALPSTVRHLEVSGVALPALARSPLASQLESLVVGIGSAAWMPLLGAFPKLRSLSLWSDILEPIAFVAAALPPSLRELRFRSSSTSYDIARTLAEAYGPQLELLELPGLAFEIGDRLSALVAGDLWANPDAGQNMPHFAGELPRAPVWDYPFVRFT